jgi:hypothetical protein
MVLIPIRTAVLAAALAACIRPTPPPRLAQATPVAIAFLHQTRAQGWSAAVPAAFSRPQTEALESRNLVARSVDPATAGRLVAADLTRARLATLAAATDTPVVVLLETSSRYDSQLAGRYRWAVAAKVTVADRLDLDRSVSESFDVPVTLEYDHQEDEAALADAARSVGQQLGKVIDSFVVSYGIRPGAPAPPGAAPLQKEATTWRR